jgi:hypothetical protein
MKQIIIEHYLRSEEGINMLTIYEAFTIDMLASYMGNKNECWPDPKKLARVCRMSERQLRRVLKKLEDAKIINIKKENHIYIYSFNEFWLEHSDLYLTKSFAAEAFKSGTDRPEIRTDRPEIRTDRPNTLYKNNITNNRSDLKTWKGLSETAPQGSPLFEQMKNQKH